MQIRWQDRVLNQEVLERASTTSIEAIIIKAQLRWTGHVIRMDESRIPCQLFYGELTEGKRNPGRHKKRYKDNLKAKPQIGRHRTEETGDCYKQQVWMACNHHERY